MNRFRAVWPIVDETIPFPDLVSEASAEMPVPRPSATTARTSSSWTRHKETDLVIECDVREQDLRLDGTLRANAKAASPAVRLAFDSNVGPLTYATDEFCRPSWRRGGMQEDWQHNVYAVAKSLEALRMVDRYGVSKRGEQYTGWKAIGGGRAMPASHMTSDEAQNVLSHWAGCRGSTSTRRASTRRPASQSTPTVTTATRPCGTRSSRPRPCWG